MSKANYDWTDIFEEFMEDRTDTQIKKHDDALVEAIIEEIIKMYPCVSKEVKEITNEIENAYASLKQ